MPIVVYYISVDLTVVAISGGCCLAGVAVVAMPVLVDTLARSSSGVSGLWRLWRLWRVSPPSLSDPRHQQSDCRLVV